MYLRLFYSIWLVLGALMLAGCNPPVEGPSDERNNEFFRLGRQRVSAQDYPGAMEMFEKAIETNPRSPLAHYELAMLCEQHSALKESDYINAIYHYQQAVRLRTNGYPADNARARIGACKRELLKTETLAPMDQKLLQEYERLKDENQNLKKQLEAYKTQPGARPPAPTPGYVAPVSPGFTSSNARPAVIGGTRVTPLPPAAGKSHTVKPRETLFAIAKQYGVRVDAIVAANPNANPNRLKAGQVLVIP